MILADTSAWVEYDRATGSAVDERVAELIATDGPLAVTEPVVMEVLAGARTEEREDQLRALLLHFQLRSVDVAGDFEAAARVYRRCRRAGITPRGLVDCLIVTVAWRNSDSLLAYDIDLARIAATLGVPLDPASRSD